MKKISILSLTKYSNKGPSSRYRYYNYKKCFHENNINLKLSPLFSDKYFETSVKAKKIFIVLAAYLTRFLLLLNTLFFSKKYNLIIVEYELFPYFPSIFEKLLKLIKIPYIVDYDDAIFHKYDQHKARIIRWLLKNKIAKVMQNAEAVIVGNDYLAEYANNYNDKILQLPTVVLLDKYITAMENRSVKEKDAPFVIGWIGSNTTSQYVLEVLPAIIEFVSTHNAECRFIGFDESQLTDEIKAQCNITIVPWTEETEVREILKFDVGIMPLKDDAWSKGKCGFKLIQYMSCKKPVIASPVGVNTIIVDEGVNGFLASTDEEWYSAFEQLYNDETLRHVMAENNWYKILKDYNHQINCDKYVSLIKSIVNRV